jgi:predicted LPLAT superfamily acyltransferase
VATDDGVNGGAGRNSNGGGGWNGRSRGGGAGHRFFIFLVRGAGVGFAYAFLALVVLYFVPFAPKATAAVWDYNRRTLGQGRLKALRGIFAHYYRFGQTLIDKIALGAGMEDRYGFGFDNYERFLEILDSGRGAVMIGAHVGCWEAGARFFGDYAERMHIVLYDGEHRRIKRAMERNLAEAGFRTIAVGGDGLESVLRIKRALDEGGCVCFQGDRHMSAAGTVEARFMGRGASFPRGPFMVAARMGVPVVFHYAVREGGRRYRFHFVEAMGRTERELLDEYLRATESIVRRYPRQWFNFYKFWDL